MAEHVDGILEIARDHDVIVFDQFGVLHDGTAPYPDAVETVRLLHAAGKRLAVLSNSGKRADVNARRIAKRGFDCDAFEIVMTSGEALWLDFHAGALPFPRLHAVVDRPGTAEAWGEGLDVEFTAAEEADAILLVSVPEGDGGVDLAAYDDLLATARARDLDVICANPDRMSPRGREMVPSVGEIAHTYEQMGGSVTWYGKPYAPIFEALAGVLGHPDPARVLMVGDSPHHDIAGAKTVGWRSLLVRGGLHRDRFESGLDAGLEAIVEAEDQRPDYTVAELRP